MSAQTLAKPDKKGKKKAEQKVPDYLVYEISKGKPIYYKGYKDVLNGTKTFEEIKMESKLQAWLKTRISLLLIGALKSDQFEVVAGELGLNLSKTNKRGADISVFSIENWTLDEHFSNLPPEVILEIDIQADTENTTEMDYVLEKIADYLEFGVKKIIWIFTKNRKVMIATNEEPWLTVSWNKEVEVLEGLVLNLEELVPKKP